MQPLTLEEWAEQLMLRDGPDADRGREILELIRHAKRDHVPRQTGKNWWRFW